MNFLIMMAIWIFGCVIFDGILELQGPWLMAGGAVTSWIQEIVLEHLDKPKSP